MQFGQLLSRFRCEKMSYLCCLKLSEDDDFELKLAEGHLWCHLRYLWWIPPRLNISLWGSPKLTNITAQKILSWVKRNFSLFAVGSIVSWQAGKEGADKATSLKNSLPCPGSSSCLRTKYYSCSKQTSSPGHCIREDKSLSWIELTELLSLQG